MNEQALSESLSRMDIRKNFLIVDNHNYHNKGLESLLEVQVKRFISDTLGKDVLDKVDLEIYHYDEHDEEYLRIQILFNEFYTMSKHRDNRQCLGIDFIIKGFQPFFDNGKFFSKVVYQWVSGSIFQDGVDQVYGLHPMDIYNKFNEYILTC